MNKIEIKSRDGRLVCRQARREAGYIAFEVEAGRRLTVRATHVGAAYRGQGIAEAMTRTLLDWAVGRRLAIVPECSYTARYMERHSAYARYLDTHDASTTTLPALAALATAARARGASRFFKTSAGDYAEGDVFLGVSVPDVRAHIRAFEPWTEATLRVYLTHTYHEVRLAGLLILVRWMKRAKTAQAREAVYRLYREHLPYCNNWDLVDSSAPTLLGGYLYPLPPEERMDILLPLSTSGQLWLERTAMVGTFGLITEGEPAEALTLARHFLPHPHDLMRKAVGWMLREVGKRVDRQLLIDFLEQYAAEMSSVTLSYATEHLSPEVRQYYQALRKR